VRRAGRDPGAAWSADADQEDHRDQQRRRERQAEVLAPAETGDDDRTDHVAGERQRREPDEHA
jgi:hypothetical protein